MPDSNDKGTWWHHFIAGEVGGMIGAFCCHPFDTAKTRVQMAPSNQQSSMFSLMGSIVRNEGIGALYRGVLYPFCGFGIIFSVAFGVNGVTQDFLIQRKMSDFKNNDENIKMNSSHLSMTELMTCGALAGSASSIVRTPIERVKVWSQIHHTNTIQSTTDLFKRYGFFRGLMFGTKATLSREVPQFAVYYPIYETSFSILTGNSKQSKSNVNGTIIYLSGASAGVGCWIVTYPIDVVKTKMQATPPGTYKNMIDCASKTFIKSNKNFGVFFRGLVPTMYRAAILHSAIFLLYERVVEYLDNHY